MNDSVKQDIPVTVAERSLCPISLALDMVGDRWTLVILRDLIVGKKRYKEFQDSPEKIPTNILASRLKKMQELSFVDRVLYQDRPKRYEYILKEKGRDMIPILQELARWTMKYSPDCWQPPENFWKMKP